jgi:repressor LexA
MINVGIMDGDLIAVHKTEIARNGQIVVARVEDNVTVKRYQKTRNKVTLLPENDDFDPIEVNLKETNFAIEGLYVGVIRRH